MGRSSTGRRSAFHEYQVDRNTWELIDPFPGQSRMFTSVIQIGNFVYVGLGASHPRDFSTNFQNFYRLNPINKSWFALTTFPGTPRHFASVMIHNELAYIIGGRGTNLTDTFWEFDPRNQAWRQLDIPLPGGYFFPFTIDGQGYLLSPNVVFRFEGDRWTGIPKRVDVIGNEFTVIDNKLYFGFDSSFGEVGIFDPITEEIEVQRLGILSDQPLTHIFTIDDIAYFYVPDERNPDLGTLWSFDPGASR